MYTSYRSCDCVCGDKVMRKCMHCHKKGNAAEKFIGIPKLPDRCICMGCAIDIYLIVREINTTKKAITGKLPPL